MAKIKNDADDGNSIACNEDTSILDCKGVKRLLQVLNFNFEILKDEKEEKKREILLASYLSDHGIDLINDFGHVMSFHFGDEKKKTVKQEKDLEFSVLSEKVSSTMSCSLMGCNSFVRNNRDRAVSQEDSSLNVDLMDTIHVSFCHSYDMGYRMEGFKDEELESKDEEKDETFKNKVLDEQFIELAKKMKKKREELSKVRGLERIDNNKFNNEVVELEQKIEEKDEKVKTEKAEEMEQDPDQSSYSFGLRCYYWDFYKGNEMEDSANHPGETFGQWYIPKKYKDIKQEIIQNEYETLTNTAYNQALEKAQKWLTSNEIKKMMSAKDTLCGEKCHYGIEYNTPVLLVHLLSLICYTDYTNFSYNFSKSFRRIKKSESNLEFATRKKNYHFLSKALRELVELYGTKLDDSKLTKFFTGISCELVFPTLVCRVCGPTSTTAALSVAAGFATQKGMIVSLRMNWVHKEQKYFNCSFISCYSNEEERLFIGGIGTVKFGNIVLNKTGHNFISYIKPMTKFCQILSNSLDWNNKPKKKDRKVLSRLIDHYLGTKKNKFYPFANALFKSVMEHTRFIKIDVKRFGKDKAAEEFACFIVNQDCPKMIKLSAFAKLMINLRSVSLQDGFTVGKYSVTSSLLSFVSSELSELTGKSSLKEIKLLNFKKKCEEKEWKNFETQLKNIGWNTKVEKRNKGNTKKQIPCLLIQRE